MKVLIYATTFGADLWAFTHYLDQKPEVEVRVLLDDPELFKSEGVAELFELDAELIERKWYHSLFGLRGFDPDVTIMDNRVPLFAPSPKGMILWHGFGWKGPNDEREFRWLHFSLKNCWGSAKVPNSDFIWQCFGPWDFDHRTKVSGFAPENCRILGAASHDYLRQSFDTEKAQPYYPFDVVNKPTVLIAPTWHYGDVFSHWGEDKVIFPKLIEQISELGANIILRLHDSFRFDEEYRTFLEELADDHDNVFLKYKNKNPDNLLDLQVSDLLITNYSSIANLFYATGKPTIHVYPVKDADEEFLWRSQTVAGVYKRKVNSARFIWKLPPEENGGLMAYNLEELQEKIEYTIKNPKCCEESTQEFLDEYMLGADGKNCERIWKTLQKFVYGKQFESDKEPVLVESNR
ncbi:CDP-glycerol glycerophosphotransferase family protein [Fodinibius halophilus]|uniref:Uncharacterized protein n=1 Tax=Fodinibius halophilus TaxID=1736908 RepID=A0A6M1SYY8_9BACT|nr:CDP-glycerol glycerophosphotransferase family protein [Fodinibius halophilus]NGP86877.1 hypothetical protein [Fodinibius halophilus]